MKDFFEDFFVNYPGWSSLIIVGLVFGAIITPVYFSYNADRHELYEAWRRAHNNESLTYEEWNDLRRAGLLPHAALPQ